MQFFGYLFYFYHSSFITGENILAISCQASSFFKTVQSGRDNHAEAVLRD